MNNPQSIAAELLTANPTLEAKIRHALLCGSREAQAALIEVVKFLTLAATSSDADSGGNTTNSLTPSHRVDLAWHELILFTHAYQMLCHDKFGKFVHHHPGGTHLENQTQFARTLELYTEAYGTPPSEFWGARDEATASCGNCESTGD